MNFIYSILPLALLFFTIIATLIFGVVNHDLHYIFIAVVLAVYVVIDHVWIYD